MTEPHNPERSTSHSDVELPPEERRSWGAFLTVAVAMTRRLDRELQRDHDLTLDDYGILGVLAEATARRERLGKLAARLRIPKANVTYRFQRMAEKGLVERVPSPEDARGAYAELTEEGAQRWRQARIDYLAFVRRHFLAPVDDDSYGMIADQMQRVIDAHPSGSKAHRP